MAFYGFVIQFIFQLVALLIVWFSDMGKVVFVLLFCLFVLFFVFVCVLLSTGGCMFFFFSLFFF